jgi:hypothetical protein
MKLVLTTTFLVAVLAIGLFGINNAFAQGDDGMMEGNDTNGMTMNATLAFAQGNDTLSMGNDTSMMMNATLPISIIGNNDTSDKP